jgi:hypothetical protein
MTAGIIERSGENQPRPGGCLRHRAPASRRHADYLDAWRREPRRRFRKPVGGDGRTSAMIRFVSALDVTAAGKLARGDAESDAKTDAKSNA